VGTQHEHVTQATRVCIIGKYRLAIVASLKREEIVLLSGSHPGLFSTVAVALKSDGRIAGVRRDAGLLLDSDLDGLGDLLTAVVGSGGGQRNRLGITVAVGRTIDDASTTIRVIGTSGPVFVLLVSGRNELLVRGLPRNRRAVLGALGD